MSRKVRFSLSKKAQVGSRDAENRTIVAVTIKETTGPDEAYAAKAADAKGSKNTNEELIRFSIVSYEYIDADESTKTVPCNQGLPFEAFDRWSTKARNFVAVGWRSLNAVTDEDAEDFLSQAQDVE